MKEFIKKLEDIMVAVAFAEAGISLHLQMTESTLLEVWRQ